MHIIYVYKYRLMPGKIVVTTEIYLEMYLAYGR